MGFVRTEDNDSLMADGLVHRTYGHHNGDSGKRLQACGGYAVCIKPHTPHGVTCFFCYRGWRVR